MVLVYEALIVLYERSNWMYFYRFECFSINGNRLEETIDRLLEPKFEPSGFVAQGDGDQLLADASVDTLV